MHVSIIDTSILCNIINIPFRNEKHKEIFDQLKVLQQDKQHILILPFATIIETGNHIAHISDGNVRRDRAQLMAELIKRTVSDKAPWSYYGKEFEREELLEIAGALVEHAVAEIGIGDLSIVQVFKKYKETVPAIGSIRIWSLDKHLNCYYEEMPMPRRRKNQ
ncbi:hypothetical protein PaeBR_03115 [Paenibacillus sp. BR2-3]|uniref:hypothetical protein n=1 Tax=Paenibacillus sp. BR2-3 TaxID=3048494 RepID=UPI0039776BE8